MYDFQIYVGKETCPGSGLGFLGDIVLALSENTPENKNYKICCNNWFSSLLLAVALKEKGILFAGTIQCNRMAKCNLKTEDKLKERGRGSYDFQVETSENTGIVRWYDRKSINFISSYTYIDPVGEYKRIFSSEKKCITIPHPNIPLYT